MNEYGGDPRVGPNEFTADTDGDGTIDIAAGDATGDGTVDWVVATTPEGASVTALDTDDSGAFDTLIVDADADGRLDVLAVDVDEDGAVDYVEEVAYVDQVAPPPPPAVAPEAPQPVDQVPWRPGQPGLPDSQSPVQQTPPAEPVDQVPWRPGQPGLPEAQDAAPAPAVETESPAGDPSAQVPWSPEQPGLPQTQDAAPAADPATQVPWSPEQPGLPQTQDAAPAADPATQVPWSPEQPGLPQSQPTTSVEQPAADLVWGDGASELQWGQTQTENGYCGPVSVAMIISEFTGVQHGETELVQAALDLDLLIGEPGAWKGMYTTGLETLLEHYGVPAHRETGTTDTLRNYLEEGRDIILFIDSSEVWYGTDAGENAYGGQDHFVVITEIDDTAGTITLNDPGIPNGVGLEVSIDVLNAAWADSGNEMVVTDTVPQTMGRAAAEHPGFVVLPVVVPADKLRVAQDGDESS